MTSNGSSLTYSTCSRLFQTPASSPSCHPHPLHKKSPIHPPATPSGSPWVPPARSSGTMSSTPRSLPPGSPSTNSTSGSGLSGSPPTSSTTTATTTGSPSSSASVPPAKLSVPTSSSEHQTSPPQAEAPTQSEIRPSPHTSKRPSPRTTTPFSPRSSRPDQTLIANRFTRLHPKAHTVSSNQSELSSTMY